jgi:carboxymethylenebutenolidase
MCHPDRQVFLAAIDAAGVSEERITVDVEGAAMPVFHAAPSVTSHGNVLILTDIFGANDFYHALACRLAASGYTAWLPDLFVRQGPLSEQTHEAARARGAMLSYPLAIEDIGRVVGEVERRSPGKRGAIGFCMGGTLVMLLASREPRIDAGVIYYGFPANPNRSENRPWQPIDEATQVRIPLLGFWGDQDRGVGMDNVAAYRDALTAADRQYDFVIYPGLPHGFLTFDETSANYVPSQDSWERALAFLGNTLT